MVRNVLKGEKDLFVLSNPFTNYVEVEVGLNETGNAHFRLMDASGKVFFKKDYVVNKDIRIRIPATYQMASGVYILECVLNGKRYVKTLLKK